MPTARFGGRVFQDDSELKPWIVFGAIILLVVIAVVVLSVSLLPASIIASVDITTLAAHAGIQPADAWKTLNDTRHSVVEVVQLIATIITAGAIVATLYFTARNVAAAERTAHNAEKAARQNLQLQREARRGERFTNAVDQLSHNSCGVRVAAIHILARIARESEEDHWPVVELLSAFLRDQRGVGSINKLEIAAPPEDVRAIASFFCTRNTDFEKPGQWIDLSLTNLHDLNFDNANLRGADFSRCELSGARFRHADLSGATLVNVNASGAIFSNVNLTGSFLNGANFAFAQMDGADLNGASIQNATFTSVSGPILNVTETQQKSAGSWDVQ
jgi:uncharacterized protein YjbI with pentapeptide repeats